MTAPCAVPQSALASVWLGPPGALAALPIPDNVSATIDRGETDHQLVSGGMTTTKRPDVKRTYPLAWSQLTADEADPLVALYAGVRGRGPFILVDPRWRNLFDLDVSTMVGSVGAVRGWATATAAPNPILDTADPPPLASSSGVLRWPTPANNGYLWAGQVDDVALSVDGRRPAPFLGVNTPGWASVWVRLATAQANITGQMRLTLVPSSRLAAGAPQYAGTSLTLSTTWQRLMVDLSQIAVAPAATAYVVPSIVVNGAGLGATDVLVAGAQLTTERAVTAARASKFAVGLGCPRVTLGAGFGDASSVLWRRSPSITLNEV